MIGSFLTLTVIAHLFPLAIALRVDFTQSRTQSLSKRGSGLHTITSGGQNIECDGDKYGDDLQYGSCQQVLTLLSQDTRQYTWGPHGSHMELITPRRILSRK